jgi:hypothetical protein
LYSAAANGADTDGYTLELLDNTNNTNLSNPLATEDINDFTTTSIGSKDLTLLTDIGANVDIDFSSMSAFIGGGTTKIGARLSGDISNSTPSGDNHFRIDTSGDNPYLWVEYTEATATTNTTNFFSIL